MKVLEKNKGLIMFYLCISILMVFWVSKVEKDNDLMMHQKTSYMLTNAR